MGVPNPERELTTRELLDGYLRNQPEFTSALFQKLGEELRARVRRHSLWRHLRSTVDVEDVVHEVLWRALSGDLLRRIEDRGPGTAIGFLAVVLDRTLKDQWRRRRVLKRQPGASGLSLDEVCEGAPAATVPGRLEPTTPSEPTRAADFKAYCLSQLPDRERQVWNLVECEGRTTEEAAGALGMSGSSVRGLLFRARTRLARLLTDGEETRE